MDIISCECGNLIQLVINDKEVAYCSKCGKKLLVSCPRCKFEFMPGDESNPNCSICNLQFVSCCICGGIYAAGKKSCSRPSCNGELLQNNYNYYTAFANERRSNSYLASAGYSHNLDKLSVGGAVSNCVVYFDSIYFWKSGGSYSELIKLLPNGETDDRYLKSTILRHSPEEISFLDLQGFYLITCVGTSIFIHSILDGTQLFAEEFNTSDFRVITHNEDVFVQINDDNDGMQVIRKYHNFGKNGFKPISIKPSFKIPHWRLPVSPLPIGKKIYFANFDNGVVIIDPKNENTFETVDAFENCYVNHMAYSPMDNSIVSTVVKSGEIAVFLYNLGIKKSSSLRVSNVLGYTAYKDNTLGIYPGRDDHGQYHFSGFKEIINTLSDANTGKKVIPNAISIIDFFTVHCNGKDYIVFTHKRNGLMKSLSYWDVSSNNSELIGDTSYRHFLFPLGTTLIFVDKEKGRFFTKELV